MDSGISGEKSVQIVEGCQIRIEPCIRMDNHLPALVIATIDIAIVKKRLASKSIQVRVTYGVSRTGQVQDDVLPFIPKVPHRQIFTTPSNLLFEMGPIMDFPVPSCPCSQLKCLSSCSLDPLNGKLYSGLTATILYQEIPSGHIPTKQIKNMMVLDDKDVGALHEDAVEVKL